MPASSTQTIDALLSIRDVVRRTSLSRATIYKLAESNRFPAPLQLTEGRKAWVAAEVDAWLSARLAEREAARRFADSAFRSQQND
jgi:prophage regulatory protein